jgi:hypothetical protein
VETYRQRIKAVILERDAVRAQNQPPIERAISPEKPVEKAPAAAIPTECCGLADGPNCAGCAGHFSLENDATKGELIDVVR